MRPRRHVEPVDDQLLAANRAAFRFLDCLEVAADHLLRHGARGLDGGIAGIDQLAAAQDGRGVAQRFDLMQLVGNVEDRTAFAGELAQNDEELLHLLRRQNRRRLVHDQKLGVQKQRAHDLDALALTHGERRNNAMRLELEAILRHDLLDARFEFARRDIGIHAKRDVFQHRHRLEEREVLEHHADAELAGSLGVCNDDALAIPPDFAAIGLHDPVDHLDEGGLARTVFPEKRVDFAGLNGKAHLIVRQHARKALRNALQLQPRGRIISH